MFNMSQKLGYNIWSVIDFSDKVFILSNMLYVTNTCDVLTLRWNHLMASSFTTRCEAPILAVLLLLCGTLKPGKERCFIRSTSLANGQSRLQNKYNISV